jgi:tRNA nucleotidyltransferase/poly(A) polymerase
MSRDSSHSAPPAPDERMRTRAVSVVRALREAGHEAVFAGGCVRDQVLGNVPHDYDIATSAVPEEVLALFDRTVPVGASFGVVRVLIADHEFEVATFRTEGGYSDGRRPDSVQWASARDDVLRRDFTINGLLFDPLEGEGVVIDHVGGLEDLRAGVVRAIGDPDARFEEDKLRLLRAIRFAARLGFVIAPDTWDAIVERAAEVTGVSVERIRDELQRMCTQSPPASAFEMLDRSGLWRSVLPEVTEVARVLDRLQDAAELSPHVAWTTLSVDLSAREAVALCKRMKLSSATVKHVERAVQIHDALKTYSALDLVERKRLLRNAEAETALHVAGQGARGEGMEAKNLAAARADLQSWTHPELFPETLVTGADLIAAGRSPGPGFKGALEAVESAQLAGEDLNRESALALALSQLA